MRKTRAPQHDLAKPMQYVPSTDGAWDVDRVDLEVADLRAKWEAEHAAKLEEAHAAQDGSPTQLTSLAVITGETFEPAEHHPFYAYFSGRTRYDLDDEELQPYLRRDLKPEIWRLRQLGYDQRTHAAYLLRKDLQEEAYFYAFLHGVCALEGVEDEGGRALAKAIAELPAKRLHRHEEPLKAAIAGYAMGVVFDVGAAIVQASMDLTSAEGKPSASPRGA